MSMAGEHELNRDIDVDLGGIFGSIWRNKFKLLLVSLIVTALTFVLLQLISPRYQSDARVLIRASDSVLSDPNASNVANLSDLDDPGIASQVQLLRSRAIASKVIKQLRLKEKPEFDSALNRSPITRILSMLGLVDDNRSSAAEDRVLEAYFEKLQVFQAERARVIVVQFWSKDSKLAAAIPNLITDEYLKLQEELKRGANPAELEKLEPELKSLRASVMVAESAVAEFRENSDLLQGRNNNSLATQELSELSTELGRVRSQLSRAEANAAAISNALRTGTLDTASSVLQSPLIQRLRERQVTLSSQLSELSTTLLDAHPRIQRLRTQTNALSNQIRTEALKIEKSSQQDARIARAREADLIQRQNELKSEAGRVGRAQVELRSLEREADAQRQLLNSYLVRFKEAQSRQSREFLPADAYVFSKAQVQSKAYFPKKIPMLAGAFFGTFVFGSMITIAGSILTGNAARQSYADEMAAKRMFQPEFTGQEIDAANTTNANDQGELKSVGAPPLVPSMESLTGQNPGFANGVSSTAVAAKSIAMLGKARVAVLSPDSDDVGDGATALARFLSGNGSSVIVVDMAGGATSTKTMLGNSTAMGIKDLMSGMASFGETIHSDRASGAHIMPMGNAPSQAAAGSAAQLPAILDALQETYRYVVIDCGAADAGGLSRVSDPSTVNIINACDPNSQIVRLSSEMLSHAGFRAPLIVHTTQEEKRLMGLAA